VDFAAELPVLIPGGSALVVFAWLIVHVSRLSSGDRSEYQKRLIELRREHRDEIKGLTERHDKQIDNLRKEVKGLRDEVADVRKHLEEERRARWRAEDAAARYRRMIDGYSNESSGRADGETK